MIHFRITLFCVCIVMLHGMVSIAKPETAAKERWYLKPRAQAAVPLSSKSLSDITIKLPAAGSYGVFRQKDPRTAARSIDATHSYSLNTTVRWEGSAPLKLNTYLQDKDGYWFQSQRTWVLEPQTSLTLSQAIQRGVHGLRAVGHDARWGMHRLATIKNMGVSVVASGPGELSVSKFALAAKKTNRPPLEVYDWDMPTALKRHGVTESHFQLSREYVNPFDPTEIKVDVQAILPSGKMMRWPAYFFQDYTRRLDHQREVVEPRGAHHWALRMTPTEVGKHKVRIVVVDYTSKTRERIMTPWRELTVEEAGLPGFVQANPDDSRYFSLSTGEWFFPLGMNIHTPKDVRAEGALKLQPISDLGTYSYDAYFDGMAKHGMNSCEIWMASWSMAIEWTARWSEYHGLGRYNLANAWRMDHLIERAREKGIYLHLVLDNHGKASTHADQEWSHAPYNTHQDYAAADNATIEDSGHFFGSEATTAFVEQRNRYIAGRWGMQPNIFGIEFWSEINLVTNHRQAYDDGTGIAWHKRQAEFLLAHTQWPYLLTTHYSGDYKNLLRHRYYTEMPELTYLVADAYRGKVPIIDHMVSHRDKINPFGKPQFITEYGGNWHGTNLAAMKADVHAGIWASFFLEFAGTPYLWWHEFVHTMGNYGHYLALSQYLKDINPVGKNYASHKVNVERGGSAVGGYYALLKGNTEEMFGWVYHHDSMVVWPESDDMPESQEGCTLTLPAMKAGTYRIVWYDTLPYKAIHEQTLSIADSGTTIDVPPFVLDKAFKLRPVKAVSQINAARSGPGSTP